ncbi:hypothetical protein [Actinomadura sp. 6N118]|uniref:hypothetical protein n=1 Tax=Actinomadura sp. 6N118 TaxID=3375151 RepID=UPI0037C095DB
MITCAAGGQPRVCVPDWGELRVIDDRRLRLAVWPSAPIAADMDHGAPILLIVTVLSEVHLIHATARRLANAAMVWAHYELTITSARIADRGTAPHSQAGNHAGKEFLPHRLPKGADKHREYRRDRSPSSRQASAITID